MDYKSTDFNSLVQLKGFALMSLVAGIVYLFAYRFYRGGGGGNNYFYMAYKALLTSFLVFFVLFHLPLIFFFSSVKRFIHLCYLNSYFLTSHPLFAYITVMMAFKYRYTSHCFI